MKAAPSELVAVLASTTEISCSGFFTLVLIIFSFTATSSLGAAFIERFEELNSGGRRGRSRLPHNDKSTPNAKRVKVRPPAVTLSTEQQIEALKKIDLDELKMANPISIVAPGAGPEPAIKSTKAALAHSRTALEHIIHRNRNNDAENEDINENDLDSGKIKDKQLEHVVLSKWMIKSDRHFLWRDEIEPDAI